MNSTFASAPLFLGLKDYQWEAVSAIATGAAAVIALGVPMLLRLLDRSDRRRQASQKIMEEQDARRREVEHVAEAFQQSAALVDECRQLLNRHFHAGTLGTTASTMELRQISERAASKSMVLRTLARQPRMDNDSITSLLEAATALDRMERLPQLDDKAAFKIGEHFDETGRTLWRGHDALMRLVHLTGATPREEIAPMFSQTFDEAC